MDIKKKYLINLDGWIQPIYTKPLQNIINEFKIDVIRENISFLCASLEDKYKIEKDFPKFKIFCVEEYYFKNYKSITLEDIQTTIDKLGIPFGEINYALSSYKKFYFQAIRSSKNQFNLDLKRIILNNNFYEEIFKNFKPNIIIHEHSGGIGSKILWEKCKKNKCKYFFLKGMYFNDKFALIDNDQFKSPFYENLSNNIDDEKDYELFSSKIKKSLDYMAPYEKYKNVKKKKNLLFSKIKNVFNNYIKYHKNTNELNYLLSRNPPIIDGVFNKFFSYFKNFIFKNFYVDKEINFKNKYAVLFMQVEPEINSYAMVSSNFDSYSLIKNFAINLPSDTILLVKEHPAQITQSRSKDIAFFKNIKSFSNVRIVPTNLDSSKLIKNAEFIISGSGTSLFEGILQNKRCIYYGDHFYTNHKNLLRLKDSNSVNDILKTIKENKVINDDNYNIDENIKFAYRVYKSMLHGKYFYENYEFNENTKNWTNSFQTLFQYFEKL